MKKTVALLILTISLSTLTSCKMIKKNHQEKFSLANTEWTLVSIGDRKYEKLQGMHSETIDLSFQTNSFGSTDGCNAIGAEFTQNNNEIEVSTVRSTRMYCDGIMDKLYSLPYGSVTSFEVKNNKLILLDASKKEIAVFKKK